MENKQKWAERFNAKNEYDVMDFIISLCDGVQNESDTASFDEYDIQVLNKIRKAHAN